MKKYFLLLAAGLLLSCSSDDSNDDNGGSSVIEETAQVYKYDDDNPTATPKEKSTISGKVYMVEERDKNGNFIYADSTMLEIGKVENGMLTLNLPKEVDSRFLRKFSPNVTDSTPIPPGLTIKPLDAEVLFYTDRLHIINESTEMEDARNDNLFYVKFEAKNDTITEFHRITYIYSSKNLEYSGTVDDDEFRINAKKGWNKVYWRSNSNKDKTYRDYITTNINEAPAGLVWWEHSY